MAFPHQNKKSLNVHSTWNNNDVGNNETKFILLQLVVTSQLELL
jgi:hypothetical protein